MEQTQLQAADKADKAAFLDAFSRMEDIGLRIGHILTAIDTGLADVIDSPTGEAMREPLVQISGLVQVLHDYQAELQKCSATAWQNQPANLFPA